MMDFQFAIRINNIAYKNYLMFPIEKEGEYRLEASMIKMERQSEQLQKEFEED